MEILKNGKFDKIKSLLNRQDEFLKIEGEKLFSSPEIRSTSEVVKGLFEVSTMCQTQIELNAASPDEKTICKLFSKIIKQFKQVTEALSQLLINEWTEKGQTNKSKYYLPKKQKLSQKQSLMINNDRLSLSNRKTKINKSKMSSFGNSFIKNKVSLADLDAIDNNQEKCQSSLQMISENEMKDTLPMRSFRDISCLGLMPNVIKNTISDMNEKQESVTCMCEYLKANLYDILLKTEQTTYIYKESSITEFKDIPNSIFDIENDKRAQEFFSKLEANLANPNIDILQKIKNPLILLRLSEKITSEIRLSKEQDFEDFENQIQSVEVLLKEMLKFSKTTELLGQMVKDQKNQNFEIENKPQCSSMTNILDMPSLEKVFKNSTRENILELCQKAISQYIDLKAKSGCHVGTMTFQSNNSIENQSKKTDIEISNLKLTIETLLNEIDDIQKEKNYIADLNHELKKQNDRLQDESNLLNEHFSIFDNLIKEKDAENEKITKKYNEIEVYQIKIEEVLLKSAKSLFQMQNIFKVIKISTGKQEFVDNNEIEKIFHDSSCPLLNTFVKMFEKVVDNVNILIPGEKKLERNLLKEQLDGFEQENGVYDWNEVFAENEINLIEKEWIEKRNNKFMGKSISKNFQLSQLSIFWNEENLIKNEDLKSQSQNKSKIEILKKNEKTENSSNKKKTLNILGEKKSVFWEKNRFFTFLKESTLKKVIRNLSIISCFKKNLQKQVYLKNESTMTEEIQNLKENIKESEELTKKQIEISEKVLSNIVISQTTKFEQKQRPNRENNNAKLTKFSIFNNLSKIIPEKLNELQSLTISEDKILKDTFNSLSKNEINLSFAPNFCFFQAKKEQKVVDKKISNYGLQNSQNLLTFRKSDAIKYISNLLPANISKVFQLDEIGILFFNVKTTSEKQPKRIDFTIKTIGQLINQEFDSNLKNCLKKNDKNENKKPNPSKLNLLIFPSQFGDSKESQSKEHEKTLNHSTGHVKEASLIYKRFTHLFSKKKTITEDHCSSEFFDFFNLKGINPITNKEVISEKQKNELIHNINSHNNQDSGSQFTTSQNPHLIMGSKKILKKQKFSPDIQNLEQCFVIEKPMVSPKGPQQEEPLISLPMSLPRVKNNLKGFSQKINKKAETQKENKDLLIVIPKSPKEMNFAKNEPFRATNGYSVPKLPSKYPESKFDKSAQKEKSIQINHKFGINLLNRFGSQYNGIDEFEIQPMNTQKDAISLFKNQVLEKFQDEKVDQKVRFAFSKVNDFSKEKVTFLDKIHSNDLVPILNKFNEKNDKCGEKLNHEEVLLKKLFHQNSNKNGNKKAI